MDGALRKWLTGNGHWFFFVASKMLEFQSGPKTRLGHKHELRWVQSELMPCFQFGSGSLCGSIFGFLRLALHDESDDFVPSM